jgi:prevent-host-death family protein
VYPKEVSRNEINLREVRARIGYLVDRAEHASEITIITRHGRPAAAIVPISLIPKEPAMPQWTARLNVIDGVITIEHDGEDTDIMRAPDGRLISTLIRVEPWAENEENLDRADAELAAEGLVRDGEWQSEGDGYVCQVRLAVGEASTFRRTRDEDPDGWGDDVITITQDGGQVTEKFHVDGIDDTNHSGFSDEDEAAEYIRRRGIELESDGYRRD